ncbi:MAG: YeeE/YedE family protein [Gemmatimonadota bacterium]|nr:YeeE/YedE family protein [Gemmatimonadota bacterium]
MSKVTSAVAAWGVAGIIYVATHQFDTQFAMYWAFGLAFGFVLQRARFCFASAFRDLFLLGHGRNMKGVLVGLAVGSLGFGLVMSRQVPMTFLGILPPSANVLPLGIHTALGGVLFGVGMVLAGGCVSGSIYRMGEGYVASWVAFAGLMGGLLASAYTWNWWWDRFISTAPRYWLPSWLGHPGAIAATLAALAAVYVGVLVMEHRAGMVLPRTPPSHGPSDSVGAELRSVVRTVFVDGWAIIPAGAVLGGLNVLLFTAQEPWGFTGEVSRWSLAAASLVNLPAPMLSGVADLPGCVFVPSDGSILNHMLFLVVGMWFGSFAGALGAGEFKVRLPRRRARYTQSLGGGVLMGYGSGLAMGCTIGAFFSGIPSLALNGWVFAVFLGGGAWIGTQLIQRIP